MSFLAMYFENFEKRREVLDFLNARNEGYLLTPEPEQISRYVWSLSHRRSVRSSGPDIVVVNREIEARYSNSSDTPGLDNVVKVEEPDGEADVPNTPRATWDFLPPNAVPPTPRSNDVWLDNSEMGSRRTLDSVASSRVSRISRISMSSVHHRQRKPTYTCPVTNCDLVFSTQRDYVTHMKEEHPGRGAFRCKVCGKELRNKQGLGIHMKIHFLEEEEEETANGKKIPKCKICGRVMKTMAGLKLHKGRMHPKPQQKEKPQDEEEDRGDVEKEPAVETAEEMITVEDSAMETTQETSSMNTPEEPNSEENAAEATDESPSI